MMQNVGGDNSPPHARLTARIFMKEFLKDIFRQAVGKSFRKGKLGITWFGQKKMFDEDLSYETLEKVFRYGEEIKQDEDHNMIMIVRKYKESSVSVGLTAQYHSGDDRYMITNCWVRKWK